MITQVSRQERPDAVARYRRTYRLLHRDRIREHDRAVRQRLRQETIEAYGGKCQCCGESQWEFLSIDHINGGGRRHIINVSGDRGGWQFYRWLKRHDYPKEEYRLLCYNCNCARGRFGYCPHERLGNTMA